MMAVGLSVFASGAVDMVLTGQQFAEVMNFLRNRVGPSLAGSDKRRTTRLELKSRVIIIPLRNGTPGDQVSVLTRDMSLEGIGLLTAVPLPKGMQFIALLPRSDNDTVFVLCESMFCSVVADGMFTIGCSFVKVVPKETALRIQTPNPAAVTRIRDSVLK